MKKLIVLFILPLTLLIAIEFKMTKQGLFPVINTVEENPTTSEPQTPEPIEAVPNPITTNHAPTASKISIKGTARTGNKLILDYTFNDIDGDTEGNSIIAWSTPTKELQRSTSKTFIIPEGYEGSKIGAWIHPTDTHGLSTTKGYRANNTYLTISPRETTVIDPDSTSIPIEVPQANPIALNDKTSSYLESVTLPECDSTNPEVQFIKNNSDWSHINNINKRIFCVSPGDYSVLRNIRITSSGTIINRRYIILNNGNNLHPGKLDNNQLANFALLFDNASYWTVDRASLTKVNNVANAYHFINKSTHNILNRAFTNKILCSVEIQQDSNNNTIQNSRFQNMRHASRKADDVTIRLYGADLSTFSIKNTKILNNEIKNSNDGIQTVIYKKNEHAQIANGEGTIIDCNHIYIDSALYTDGNGNYNPNGVRAYAENAIDLKFGSNNASNPMIITNNIIWGFRRTDRTNAYSDDPGYAVVAHYGVKNIKFNNNIIFDSNSGFTAGDSGTFSYALSDSEFKNNLIYDSGEIPGAGNKVVSLAMYSSSNVTVQNNSIIGARLAYAKFSNNTSSMHITDNIQVNCKIGLITNGLGKYDNFLPGIGYTKDYVFTTDKFRNNQRTIRLENVLK